MASACNGSGKKEGRGKEKDGRRRHQTRPCGERCRVNPIFLQNPLLVFSPVFRPS